MSHPLEARIAAEVALESGKPVWVSWSLRDIAPCSIPRDDACASTSADEPGMVTLRSGHSIQEAFDMMPEGVAAVLFNCCQPESITAGLPELVALARGRMSADLRVGAYANSFCIDSHAFHLKNQTGITKRDDLGPERCVQLALLWVLSVGLMSVIAYSPQRPCFILHLR